MDTLRPPPLKRLRPADWVALDCGFAVLLALAFTVGAVGKAPWYGVPSWVGVLLAIVAALPVAGRRRWPKAALGSVVAAAAATAVIGDVHIQPVAVVYTMYMAALLLSRRTSLWLLGGSLLVTAAGVVASAGGPRVTDRPGTAVNLLVASTVLITAGWVAGYSVRQQRAYTAGLREQAERRAREEIAEARRATSEERLRIAREMHDVVAHTLSLIAVQAGVAGYVAVEHPGEAARALASIEQTSRGALREMRALLGVLHTPEQTRELVPAPGLADLPGLVERTAEAGVTVDLDVGDLPSGLPAGLDLAAYRVIQEAITNVVKHAGTDRCRVLVDAGPDALTLEITDEGAGARITGGTGHGITGMRERVGMYGGEFQVGPGPGRGFRVAARFPLAGATT